MADGKGLSESVTNSILTLGSQLKREEMRVFTDKDAILQAAATLAAAKIQARASASKMPGISFRPPTTGEEVREALLSMMKAGLIPDYIVPAVPEDPAAEG
jgi:hypothetical protein